LKDDSALFRELNDATAIDRYLEGLDFTLKRALLGDGERANHWSMAVSFFHGADSLREIISERHGYDLHKREYAMMFLYRHSIELFLKHAINSDTRGHNLERLLGELVEQIKRDHHLDISQGWFANEIRELSKVDPTAQGFRYSHDTSGNPALASRYFVNVDDLGKRMSSLYSAFLHMGMIRGDFTSDNVGT